MYFIKKRKNMELKIFFNFLNSYFTSDRGLKIIYSCADVMRTIWLTNRAFVQQAAKDPNILLKHFLENTFSRVPNEERKYLIVEPQKGTSEINIFFDHKKWILDNLKQQNYRKYKTSYGLKYQYFFKIPIPTFVKASINSIALEDFINKKFSFILKKLNKNVLKDLKILGMDLLILNYNLKNNSLTIQLNAPVIIGSGVIIRNAIKNFLKSVKNSSNDDDIILELEKKLGKNFDLSSSDEIKDEKIKNIAEDVIIVGGMIYIIDKNFKKIIKELETFQEKNIDF